MSDSISTPAPAATPTPAVVPSATPDAPAAPPASQQPGISISDAARLLNQQRRQQAQQGPQTPPQADGTQPPTPDAAKPPAAPTPAPAPPKPPADRALDSIAKALGLEGAPAADGAAPETPAIEIDGRRLTAEEVRRAVSMSADYTKKTQALAEAQRQFQAQQEALATVLPYIQPELARLQQQIAGVRRPDVALLDSNPNEYHRQRALYEQAQDEQGRLAQLQALQMQASDRALAEQVARSNEELAKQFPDWADPQKRGEWQQKIAEWAMDRAGFQRHELARLADHRQLTVLMKAMMFDRMVAGAKTSAPMRPAPVRGAAPPPPPTERVSSAEEAFDARPSIRNAAQLLSARRAR